MSDDTRGGVSRNRSGSGLQLSRSTKGIQNTRRSFRGLGKGPPTLDNSLGKIGGGGGGKKPVIADDLSIDDSVLESDSSEIGERTRRAAPKGPSLLGGGGGSDSEEEEDVMPKSRQRRASESNLGLGGSNSRIRSRTTSRESVRMPPRKNSNRQKINELSRSDHAESSKGRRRTADSEVSTSRSDHQRSSSRKNREDDLSISKSDHQRSSSRKSKEDDLSISKSDHCRSSSRKSRQDERLSTSRSDLNRSSNAKAAFRRSNTFNGKTVASADSKQHAVQGIYNLLDSMGNKDGSPKEKEASAREPRARRAILRRSRTADSSADMAQAMGKDKITTTKPSIQGIRNLLDKSDASLRDHSMKDKSQLEKSARERNPRGRRRAAADDESDSDVSEKNRPTRGEEIGTNHSASLQGIHKLLGSMNKDASATSSKVEKEKEKARDRSTSVDKKMNRSARSMRRLQSHQLTESKAKEEEEAAKQEEEAAANKRKEEEDAAASRRQARKDASQLLKQGAAKPAAPTAADDDEGHDYDSVATPKTASGPPPPLMKEAPPPPQRKNVARKPRNMLPNLQPPKPKPTNATIKSAPAKVPATPMRSPGGIVIDLQNGVSTPGAGCSTPQNFSTPQAAAMPVMPANGFDSISTPSVATPRTVGDVATPRTVGDVAPPPVSNAPPPPPKRNMDMGSRWKNRQQSRVPTLPGQAASKVPATPGAAPKAPSMTMLSPGGIVIEVSSKKSGIKGANRPPEPMTPMAEMTPMTSRSGLLSNSPHYNGLRNSMSGNVPIVPSTPCMQQSRSGSMANGSWMSTPSMQSNSGDISELTPGTFVGSHRMTPRETPRSRQVPSTPSLYNSPGVISELTPGGYSVGLLGDDDYIPSGRDDAHLMTPRTYGILLEEADEDEGEQQAPLPSTPSLASPAGIVSEMTPDGAMTKRRLSPVAPLHVPATPSHNDSNAGIVSELTPGTSYGISAGRPPIPTTPSVHSPAGIVSELTPLSSGDSKSEDGVRNIRMLSNVSNHSGVVSDITPGSFSTRSGSTVGQVQIAG